jgi:hypothetical protein
VSTDDQGKTSENVGQQVVTGGQLPTPSVRRPSVWSGFWRWFWLGKEVTELSHALPPARVSALRQARIAADVARRAQNSAEPFEGSIDAVLCDLYRQSIYWSLRALVATQASEDTALYPSFSELPVLRRAIPEPLALARVQQSVESDNFENLAAIPADERALLLVGLRNAALALIVDLEADKRAIEAVWARRIMRVLLLITMLVFIAFVVMKTLDTAEQSRDLARGAPWRASSVYGSATTCRSPAQECIESPDFFFHTEEEQSPWIEFDLGSTQSISGLRVENRRDCCMERASPMVIEVSKDQLHWQTVARRDSVFSTWRVSFAPAKARWVRLRLEKREHLHLAGVRILH